MKQFFLAFTALAILYFSSACSHKQYKYNETVGNEASGLKLNVEWLKNKKKQIDIKLTFENISNEQLSINDGAIIVQFAGQTGILRSDLSSVQLSPHQKVSRVLMYIFSPPISNGMVTMTIDPIVLTDSQGKTRDTKISVNLQVP